MPQDVEELIAAAREARQRAYAPYSGYAVGAAVRDENGDLHSGCNVENVSYPAGICAERVAITTMVASGGRKVRSLAVVTEDGGTPCGICLQVLLEFGDLDETKICAADTKGKVQEFALRELIPHGFSANLTKRMNEPSR